jgi:hypothetical protein
MIEPPTATRATRSADTMTKIHANMELLVKIAISYTRKSAESTKTMVPGSQEAATWENDANTSIRQYVWIH